MLICAFSCSEVAISALRHQKEQIQDKWTKPAFLVLKCFLKELQGLPALQETFLYLHMQIYVYVCASIELDVALFKALEIIESAWNHIHLIRVWRAQR